MGNMITRRPDLFGAVCCAVPLLDMHRYHTLLAGASWVAEYGDPSTSVSVILIYDTVELESYECMVVHYV